MIRKIVVIDDRQAILEDLVEMLKLEGWEAIGYTSSLEAVTNFVFNNPDLIITDMLMPEVSGSELIQFVKSHNPEIKVIVVSAVPELREESLESGADIFLPKPFSLSNLVETVKGLHQ